MRIPGWFRWMLPRSKPPAETLVSQLKGLDEQQFKAVIDCVQREFSRRYPAEDSNGSSSRPSNGSQLHIVPRSRRPSQLGWYDIIGDALLRGANRRSPEADERLTDEERLTGAMIDKVWGQKDDS